MLEWMGNSTTSALHGRDAVTLLHDLIKRADTTPIPAPACAASGECFPELTGDDIRIAAIDATNYPTPKRAPFAQALKEAIDTKNASAISAAGLPISHSETSFLNSNFAIACQDSDYNQSWPEYQQKQFMTSALSLDTSGNLGERMWAVACQRWPTAVRSPPEPMMVRNASAPILLVNALWDPATGYDGMLNVHEQIEGSVVLTRYGQGHGSLAFPKTREVMYEYLISGRAPEEGDLLVDEPVAKVEGEFELQGWGRGG